MAYTKYSLTPADNNAAPPNGAPEGMLPSGVNDTMRDMMSQIRDVGDGIRGGTYTMTAPVITGGSIAGATISTSTLTGNTFTNPVISGGSINNTPIGATTANTGKFTTLEATGATTFSGATVISGSLTANTFSSSGATITGGAISGITDLDVADGGTGASSITANSVILGNGSSTLSGNLVAPGSSGNVLTSNGTTWTSAVGPYALTSDTAVASTSGSSIDFTGIPSWVKRITVMFSGVGSSSTPTFEVRLGTSGGVQSTSYVASAGSGISTASVAQSTSGFPVRGGGGALSGIMTIALLNSSSNVWVASFTNGVDTNQWGYGGGTVTMTGTVTRVQMFSSGTFSAGSFNILYE